jgi:acyl-homoserine lactone acylase PvdQ
VGYRKEKNTMSKAMMQKWQRDWFVKELDRDYDPMIQAAQLKIRSLEAEAVEVAEKKPGR